MKTKRLLGIILILCVASTAGLLPLSSAATLTTADFKSESWSKTVDYFNYLRLHEAFTGKPVIPSNWNAWTYMTYINTAGFQLLYAGLQNVTFGSLFTITIPAQTILMHYKTENTSTDVVTASSFLMLMAFQDNETAVTIPNSPDLNDTLYASISRGIDLTSVFGASTPPELSSKTKVIPLNKSDDGLHWSWGMQYTNLTAFWFKTWIDPSEPRFDSSWVALTRYDELTFTYDLTIDKNTHKATLTENHIIGRMRDLYFWDIVPSLGLVLLHFNSTGCYRTFLGTKLDGYPTIYGWLEQNKIKMSIIQFQTTMMINHTTQSKSGTQDVTDKDVNVSSTDVSTTSDTGEKIFDASFGTKATYRLYNYTADHNEKTYSNYTAVTRTSKIRGFAFNAVIEDCSGFLRNVPYALKDMDDTSYNYYKDHTLMLNVTGANYLYIISYPTYSGYRIIHDPIYTAYFAPAEAAKYGPIIVLAIIVAATVLVVAVVLRRRKSPGPQRTPQPEQ